MIFLGIDTSCYTTSIAAVDENGNVLSDQRKLLSVPMVSAASGRARVFTSM